MSVILKRVWREPVLFAGVLIAALNAALLLPDVRAAVASVVASLASAAGLRKVVAPVPRDQ